MILWQEQVRSHREETLLDYKQPYVWMVQLLQNLQLALHLVRKPPFEHIYKHVYMYPFMWGLRYCWPRLVSLVRDTHSTPNYTLPNYPILHYYCTIQYYTNLYYAVLYVTYTYKYSIYSYFYLQIIWVYYILLYIKYRIPYLSWGELGCALYADLLGRHVGLLLA